MAVRSLIIGGHTNGIGDEVCKQLVGENTSHSELAVFMPTIEELDVSLPGTISAYMAANGPFDRIVYSAGISKLQWIKDADQETMDKVFDVNVFGAILVAQGHLSLFPDAAVRYAVVVSDASDTPMRGSIAYCASKAALEMAVRVMARELSPLWVTVAVSPGVVDDTGITNQLAKDIPAFRNWTPEEARQYEDKGSVLGRRITKEEVADAIAFVIDGPAGLNGSTVTINGGK